MTKCHLSTLLVSDEFGVRLSISVTKYENFKSENFRPVRQDGEDFDFGVQQLVDLGSWTIEASSLVGLADGIRTNLSRILSVLRENGFQRLHGDPAEDCTTRFLMSQFNTGNDFKLVCGLIDFLTEVYHPEQG